MSKRVVDPVLFHRGDPAAGPVLAGSRCTVDGTVVFPAQESCPRCTGRDVSTVALAERGTLWSWTTQHVPPKAPFKGDPVPFTVGYVDLGDVIVEARLRVDGHGEPWIGQPVRLSWEPAWTEPDGTQVLTYAFEAEASEVTA